MAVIRCFAAITLLTTTRAFRVATSSIEAATELAVEGARTSANVTAPTSYKTSISDCGNGKLACVVNPLPDVAFTSAAPAQFTATGVCKESLTAGTLKLSSATLTFTPGQGNICSDNSIKLSNPALGELGVVKLRSPGCPTAVGASLALNIDLSMGELGWFVKSMAKSIEIGIMAKIFNPRDQLILCAKLDNAVV